MRFITPRQLQIHASYLRTQSMSDTARELGISQIRVREGLVQYQRNLIRGAGDHPPTLKAMQRGDVTTRFNVSRDLRHGRPAKHQAVVQDVVRHGTDTRAAAPHTRWASAGSPQRLLITGLDPAAPPHHGFLKNLRAYAAHLGADLRLHVIGNDIGAMRLPTELRGLVDDRPMTIGDRVEVRCDIALPRYSRFPLDGLQRLSPGRRAIFIHGTPQLESLPRIEAHPPRIQMTSGLATSTRRIIGHRVVDQLEHLGAVVIEIDAHTQVHARRISAPPETGDFHDLDASVTSGKVRTGERVEALVLGDLHYPLADPQVISATWGDGGLVEQLRPRHLVLHDVADFHARNHHDARNHHASFRRFVSRCDDVRAEVHGVSKFLAETRRTGCVTHVVASNHDHALVRWLRESDHKTDPVNAEFYLECERVAYAQARTGRTDGLLSEVLRSFATDRLGGVEFVGDGSSLMLAGVEHGVHGDRGPDGKRGSISYFESMGMEMTIGHFHRPTIRSGLYVAGLCTNRVGYERGPTTRAIAHVITHSDGTRQHVFLNGGRYSL